MSQKFAIDACALIEAGKIYNIKKKTCAPIWAKSDELIHQGRLISSCEVLEELKDQDILIWAKQRREIFLPLNEPIQEKTREILSRFPRIIKIRGKKGDSNADPFLIATALLNDCTVVTNEKAGDESTGDWKIPNVCRQYNIECINLGNMLDRMLD